MPRHKLEPTPQQRSSRLIWRICFLAYAVVLTVATHWPQLRLGSEQVPAPDKLIHLLAFATLAILMWASGWFTREFAAIAIGWTVFDEVTQAFPALGRDVTLSDCMASLLGVLIVIAFRWAMQPIGGVANRARQAFHASVFDQMFLRPKVWLITGLAIVATTAVLGPPVFWMTRYMLGSELIDAILLGLVAGVVVGSHVALEGQWRRACGVALHQRPCAACGAACADAPADEHATIRCPTCGQDQWIGQWSCRTPLPRSTLLTMAMRPAVITLAAALAIGAVYLLVLRFRSAHPVLEAIHYWHLNSTADLRLAIDLALIALLIALWLRLFRSALCKRLAKTHQRCVRCAHNLRGTPTKGGIGRCSECGTSFFALPVRRA